MIYLAQLLIYKYQLSFVELPESLKTFGKFIQIKLGMLFITIANKKLFDKKP